MISNEKSIKTLTNEQEKCVDFNSGDLLIKGVPGSGKSYVIMKRAIKLKEKHPDCKVMVLTFANTLVKYTDELLRDYDDKTSIEVKTVDKYCWDIYRDIKKCHINIINEEKYAEIIQKSVTIIKSSFKIEHRLFDEKYQDFLKEEIKWIRDKCILNKTMYKNAERRGRGANIRLNEKDKEIVWSIYAAFRLEVEKHRYVDLSEIYLELNKLFDNIPEKYKIDYLLVDEAQDLTISKMRVLKALSKKSITIAADFAQKIYSTTFTWKEVGVDISGNSSKSLTKSFRSTKQIVALAESLIETNRNAPDSADEYTNAVLPELDGPLPILYEFDSSFDKKTMLVERLKNLSKKDITVGIMCRTVEHVNVMTRLLRNAGISFEIIQKNREWSLLKSGIKVVKTHSSKGLEFDVVIIPNLEDNVYPYEPFNIEDDQLETVLERERKILYVAMTRARKALIMFCDLSISSRFISEFKEGLYEKKYISNRHK